MTSVPTIFAVSSGHGRAGVAVVRLSGPQAGVVLDLMAGPRPQPRFAAFRRIKHPATREIIDEGLALYFAAPKTETGEDMAELHIHGGRAVIAATLAAIGDIEGCRLAEPGEFSRRAFLNGKLDLTAVEGLADLVEADTQAQRRQAMRQLAGAVGSVYRGWRERLVEALALVEAGIDFSDEGDVARDAFARARSAVAVLSAEMRAALKDGRRGEIVRDGFRVALAGAPNAGKSSLLNALAKRDAAIVSDEPGTTRDVIEVRLDLGGLPVIVSDTAGIRDASGAVEREGIRRTFEAARQADLVVWIFDAAGASGEMPPGLATAEERMLVVANKVDITGGVVPAGTPTGAIGLSVRSGEGLDDLQARIATAAQSRIGSDEAVVVTQARHRTHLAAAVAGLVAFLAGDADNAELRAEDLRLAAAALGRVTGQVDAEEVLGAIFGRFCIGK